MESFLRKEKINYQLIAAQVRELVETEPFYVSALSNVAAVLMDELPELNWVGFYLMRNGKLVVGPFQGKPACIHIAVGKGVCGTSVERDETLVVADVHAFSGHIACDSASNSEIVIPLHDQGKIVGVLDIDSPRKERFSDEDRTGLEEIVRILEKTLEWKI